MDITFKKTIMNTELSGIASIVQKANELGDDVIHLEVGDVDFDPPQNTQHYINDAFQFKLTHYPPVQGNHSLIQKIIAFQGDPTLTENNVLITSGGSMGVYLALQTIIKHGDKVVIFEPLWQHFTEMIKLAQGIPISLKLDSKNNYHLTAQIITELEKINPNIIIINSPNNPTGTVYRKEEIEILVDFCKTNNVAIICDEEYEAFCYQGVHVTDIRTMYSKCIVSRSFSKTFSMAGLRLGYAIGPEEWIQQMKKWSLYSIMYPSSIIQHAMCSILDNDTGFTTTMVNAMNNRIKKILPILDQSSIKYVYPEGSVYLWLDLNMISSDDVMLTNYILKNARVAVVPGSFFGNAGTGYIRLSLGAPDDILVSAVKKIVNALEIGGKKNEI